MSRTGTTTGVPVCRLDDLDAEAGVTVLVGGEAVAVFKTYAGTVFALRNYDPVSRASVLARGIVGTRMVEGVSVDFVASPMHKQAFALATGECLDDPTLRVPAYDVDVVDGVVMVGAVREEGA